MATSLAPRDINLYILSLPPYILTLPLSLSLSPHLSFTSLVNTKVSFTSKGHLAPESFPKVASHVLLGLQALV